ncbi:sodium/solute symporter [Puniceicoccales bacterium CK1056]|uniref:Sodium/solute symporter n=1 Tax=Oceanipulchritudo coccoides TaxID=2706888 RepID=A0A6B2M1D3_9BACT|nr:sodium/solute symporter [Oceanipulchritudo coccoides]NDV62186.1 sodium/solute symporter [Oceanipulchritudo coccoides]
MGPLEISILTGYFVLILSVGWLMGRHETSVEDYFVGRRQIPWWAVLGSLVATEVSAATYLAVPAVGFSENLTYLQFGVGSFFARIFVATVFIGAFYKADCLSIYEYLQKRFGQSTQYTASVYFLVTRILASGVRLMIAVTGFSVILNIPFGWSLLLFGSITLGYTFMGGIRSVIWTDCIQGIVFIAAGLAGASWLLNEVGGSAFWQTAAEAGRWELVRWVPEGSGPLGWFNDSQWVVTAILFGFASTVAALGTDQDMAQRLLSSKSARHAKRSLIVSGFIALPVAGLFLFLGVALYVYFQANPDPDFPTKLVDGHEVPDSDKAFSYFMVTAIPAWLKGLLLTGVLAAAMSSLDSAMAALSTSTVRDLLQPLMPRTTSASRWLWTSRAFTVLFAILLMLAAWFLRDGGKFLWLAFKITSLTYGSLLGVFLLGIFSKRGSDRVNLWAMLAGTALSASGLWLIETGALPLAWTWLLLIGTSTTFLIGLIPHSGLSAKELR